MKWNIECFLLFCPFSNRFGLAAAFKKTITQLMNHLFIKLFVEQPLVLPGLLNSSVVQSNAPKQ